MNALATPTQTDSFRKSDVAAEPGEAWQSGNTAADYSSRALECQKQGRANEASKAAIRAISLDPNDAVALKVLARIHLNAGQHEAAQQACRLVLRRNKQDAEAREMMGEAQAQEARLAENLFRSDLPGSKSARTLPPLEITPAPIGKKPAPANQTKPEMQAASLNSQQRPMIYLGDHTALTRTVFGQKIYVDTRDISLAPHILLDGFWEMWITRLFVRLIEPGMTVIDIGANIGYYSLLAGSNIGPNGKVICFEANPSVFRLMANSMEINGLLDRAELVNKGVMDKKGELKFYSLASHHGSSSFVINPATVSQYRDSAEEMVIPCISLDEYFADRDPRVDVIKIDAEGAEPAIIAGAVGVLTQNPGVKILMEYTPVNRSAVDTLLSLGFKMWNIANDSTLAPVGIEQLDKARDLSMLYLSRE